MRGIANCFLTDIDNTDYVIFGLTKIRIPTEQEAIAQSTMRLIATASENNKSHEKNNGLRAAHNIFQRLKEEELFNSRLGEDLNHFIANSEEGCTDYGAS